MNQLKKLFGERLKINEPLSKHTTWKVGGPAELFLKVNNSDEIKQAIDIATVNKIYTTILGWGSNVLVSDNGIKGLVLKNTSTKIEIKGNCDSLSNSQNKDIRLKQLDTKNFYSFDDINYTESETQSKEVWLDSGVALPFAINYLINKGLTGLQWFSGIPGTIGGALFNNIHGGTHFFSEYVLGAEVIDEKNNIIYLSKNDLKLGYDKSIFHNKNLLILRVKLCLNLGDKKKAMATAKEWAVRKQLQPANSTGCVFQNLSEEKQKELSLESNSWGYIIDNILNLKGTKKGRAMISSKHAAFIETQSGSSSQEILFLLNLIVTESFQKLGIKPIPEIIFLGFKKEEINNIFPNFILK
jgi:UDP-N-acetylmuramate dehydrogenase